ncbi:hypothetical protein, partial [Pseudomonas fragi]|uniref:hypothetical protein n=1 Tax=Pseudomonas fragi TaxID=296 RepID=UPI0028E30289
EYSATNRAVTGSNPVECTKHQKARTLCGLFVICDLAIAVILATCLVFILVLVPARQRLQG